MKYAESFFTVSKQVEITNLLEQQSGKDTIGEIFKGLTAKQKYISSRFFYDKTGSGLFERITSLKEYYLTRTEKAILRNVAPLLITPDGDIRIIELGSGDCSKISILLDAIPEHRISSTTYFPVDISESAILKSAEFLAENYQGLLIHGLLADFMKHLEELPGPGQRLICFFGSTIGNLNRLQAEGFLARLNKLMCPGDSLLVGFDMVKEIGFLEAAYNDSQGVTEEFNKNILRSVNHIAKTDFIPEHFTHVAFYNSKERRVEMHVEAKMDMLINSPHFSQDIYVRKGESIHTENSHKYTPGDIDLMANHSGLKVKQLFTDKYGWFSLVILTQ